MKCPSRSLSFTLVLLAGLVASSSQAAVFIVPNDRTMIAEADAIVVATASARHSEVASFGEITTLTTFQVEDVLKGPLSLFSDLTTRELGGFVDGRGMMIPGVPQYEVGDRGLLFLARTDDGGWRTWGWELGRFEFVKHETLGMLLVRGLEDGGIVGLQQYSNSPHLERLRTTGFLDFIRATVRGDHPALDYFTAAAYDDLVRDYTAIDFLPSAVSRTPYLLLAAPGGPGLRRSEFDGVPSTITYPTGGSQSGVDELAATDAAMAAWTDDSASSVQLSRSGTHSNTDATNDGVDQIVFDMGTLPFVDPNGLAWTQIYFGGPCCTHVVDSETFYTIDSADVLVKSTSGSIGQVSFDQLMAHELGHAIGFRHSNQSGTGSSCSSPLPCSSAAIMKTTISNNYGADLQEWDSDAVQTVYGTGPVCTPVTLVSTTPLDKNSAYNESTTLSVNVQSGRSPFTFQWYKVTGAAPLAVGTNNGNLSTGNLTETTQYYAEVSNACTDPAVVSRTATVTVGACIEPSITTHPASATIESGQSVTLSVTAAGSKTLQYQWYLVDAANNATLISGATSRTYSTGPLTTTTRYKVRVQNDCGEIFSNVAAISVGCTLPEITQQPVAQTINNGETATLTVVATGATAYQWYQVTDAGNVPVGDGTSVLSVTPNQTSSYFVQVSNACGPIASETVTVTVIGGCVGPTITANPISHAIGIGESTTLSVEVLGSEPFTYQWYVGASGDVTTPVAGATSSVLATGVLTTTTSYWVQVTNSCGTANSTTATITAECRTPRQTEISVVPSEVQTGNIYTVSWDALPGVGSFELDEAKSEDFSDAMTSIVNGTSKNIVQIVLAPTRFYYRVRGIADCDDSRGSYSRTGTIAVTLPPDPASEPDGTTPFGSDEPVSFDVFIPGDLGQAKEASSIEFSVTTSEEWLTVEPSTGTLPPEGTTVTVTAETDELPVGTNTGALQITITNTASAVPVVQGSTTSTVPVSVTLVTPVTPVTKTTPNASSIIIPGVAHASGLNSQWQSDVRIVNTEFGAFDVELNYTPQGADGYTRMQSSELTIQPGTTTALNDILKNWFGQGALPNENPVGSLEIRPSGSSAKSVSEIIPLATIASSRTFNKSSQGTFGQFIPGIPFGEFVGENLPGTEQPATLSLQQVSQSDDGQTGYRTNVAIIEAAGEPVSGTISVFSASGASLGEIPFDLAPGEYKPYNQLLGTNGIFVDDARLEINVTSSTGRITAWASVVDNQSLDPILVPATELSDVGGTSWTIAGVADFQAGRTDVSWRSDIRIFNGGNSLVNATLTFYPQDNPAGASSIQIPLQAGQVTVLDDILESRFGLEDTGGSLEVSTQSEASLVVTGRTYTPDLRPGGKGTYGQFIPAATPDEAFGMNDRPLQLLQLEQSDRFRTNVGIAEVSGNPVSVRVTAIAPGTLAAPSTVINLDANEFTQLNSFLSNSVFLGNNVYNARLEIEALSGDGKFIAYGSVVDNDTQDPTYVPGQ